MTQTCILIVDQNPERAQALRARLALPRGDADIVPTPASARQALAHTHYDAILLCVQGEEMSGGACPVLALCAQAGQTPVVVLAEPLSVEGAIDAIRAGAADYLPMFAAPTQLRHRLEHHLRQQALRVKKGACGALIGDSRAMQAVYRQIENAAQSKAPVMLTGESGTGKELAARAIHDLGPRRMQPFEALNCAAMPEHMVESEIFGHARGAFTGAVQRYAGAAARAQGGTLFLDELAEMPAGMQAKLLRFTQSGAFRPLGAEKETRCDVRFICAMNRDPVAAMSQGKLREDLYHRLHVIAVHMPPLRERREDIVPLAQHFLCTIAAEEHKRFQGLSADAADWLAAQSWPGNVRELQNVIRCAVVMHAGDILSADMLRQCIHQPGIGRTLQAAVETRTALLRDAERAHIEKILASCGGNISTAARALGVNPSTLHRKLGKWRHTGGIDAGVRGQILPI